MAASSSSLRKNGKNCSTVIPAVPCNGDSGSEIATIDAYFPVPPPKRRMNVLQWMVRGIGRIGGGDHGMKQRKWDVPARTVSRKFGTVMSSVFGSRKSFSEKICSGSGDDVEKNSQGSTQKQGEGEKGKSLRQKMMIPHWGKKGPISLPSFITKKTSFKLLRGKIMSGGSHERSRILKIATLKEAKRTVKLAKVLRKRTPKFRRATKLGGKEDPGDAELCNKRILMGGKCRPLSSIHSDIQQGQEEEENVVAEPSEGETEDSEVRTMKEKRRSLNTRRKGNEEEEEEEEEEEDTELCKKRILMGEKCRPLSLSINSNHGNVNLMLSSECILP